MPRSGTKLLRDLLNQNARIGIPEFETHFIPMLVGKFGMESDFTDPASFCNICKDLHQTNFHSHFLKAGRAVPEPQDLLEHCASLASSRRKDIGWPEFFEAVLRSYAPSDRHPGFVFGDKTPSYLVSLPLLKRLFPSARFLHIIRDPRDYCLSVNRTWGKDLRRAAYRWSSKIRLARTDAMDFSDHYLEVRYEDLLQKTQTVVRRICSFLDLEFEDGMTSLSKPSEQYGQARDFVGVLTENVAKYEQELTKKQIRIIEEISFNQMVDLNMHISLAQNPKRMNRWHLRTCAAVDAIALARFHIREKGLAKAARFLVRSIFERHEVI